MRGLICLVLALICTPAFSQTIPLVDLKLTITADPPFPWRIGQVGTVNMNVTNLSKTQGTVALIQLVPAIPPNMPPTDVFETVAPESCPRNGGRKKQPPMLPSAVF